jgi:hypothetical protein
MTNGLLTMTFTVPAGVTELFPCERWRDSLQMSFHYSSVGSYRYYFSCITFGYYYDPPINLHGLSVGETVAVPTDGGSPDEGFVALNFLKGTWTSVHAAFFASVEHNF